MNKKKAFTMYELLFSMATISLISSVAITQLLDSRKSTNILEIKSVIEQTIKKQNESFLSYDSYEDLTSIGSGGSDTNIITSPNSIKYLISDKFTFRTKEIFCNSSCETPGFIVSVKEYDTSEGLFFNSCKKAVMKNELSSTLDTLFNSEYTELKNCTDFTYVDTSIDNTATPELTCENVNERLKDMPDENKLRFHDTSELLSKCAFSYIPNNGFNSSSDCNKGSTLEAFVIDTKSVDEIDLFGKSDTENILKITKGLSNTADLYFEGGTELDTVIIAKGNKGLIELDLKDYGSVYINEEYEELTFSTIKSSGDITTEIIFTNKEGGVFKFYNISKLIFNNFLKIEGNNLTNTTLSYLDTCSNDYTEKKLGTNKYASTLNSGINTNDSTNLYAYDYTSIDTDLANPNLPVPQVKVIRLLSQIPMPIVVNKLEDIEDVVNTYTGDRETTLGYSNHTTPNDSQDDVIEVTGNSKYIEFRGGGNNILNVNGRARKQIETPNSGTTRIDIDEDTTWYSLISPVIKMGNGNDIIRFGGYFKSTLDMKGGNNKLQIEGYSDHNIYSDGTFTGYFYGNVYGRIDISNATGDSTIYSEAFMDERIEGGQGNDNIQLLGDFNSWLLGNQGNDNIEIRGNRVGPLYGNSGNDKILASSSDSSIWDISGGDGNDIIESTESKWRGIYAGAGDDIIVLHGLDDHSIFAQIQGNSGNDTLYLLAYSRAEYDANKDGIRSDIHGIENILFNDESFIGDISALYTIDWNR